MSYPLFIVGNKRSETSQLVRILNLHPQVFEYHESDISWILYQFYIGCSVIFSRSLRSIQLRARF
jgi:hypothetical protein